MSRKSKMMKRAAAKKAKHSSNDPNEKSVLGIKKEKKEVKKAALIKALSEKSVTVVSPPPAVGDISGRKKRKRRNKKKNKATTNPLPNREQHNTKGSTQSYPANESMQKLKPVVQQQQQKLGPPGVGNAPSGKSKKRSRKKQNKTESTLKNPVVKDQNKTENTTEESSIDQLMNNQSEDVDKPVSSEGGSKKRKRRNRRRKVQVSSEVMKSPTEQKPSKLPKLSSEILSTKIHKPEEEASSNSEPEPIHSDWRLKSDSEVKSDSDQSSEGEEEDLDTSEEDVSDSLVPSRDSNRESSEDEHSNISEDGEEATSVSAKEKSNEAGKDGERAYTANKKFSLSNKIEILKEVKERMADFDSRCLYISPIPPDCTFDAVKKFIPKLKTCQFSMRPKSDKLRTYAFVEFEDAETASKERLSIMGRLFAGRSVRAESRAAQQTHSASTVDDLDFLRIIITGLVPTVNQADLKAIFPTAESVRLPISKSFNLGHATATFVSDAVALDAFSQCHRYPLKGHPICVNFAFKSGDHKTPTTSSAFVTTNSSARTPETPLAEKPTQPPPERIGKVLVQQMKEVPDGSDKDLTSMEKDLDAKLRAESTKSSKKKVSDDVEQVDNDDVDEDDSDDDESVEIQNDEEGSEVDDDDDDGDDDDDDNVSEIGGSDDADEDDVEALDGDDSEGEEIDATLEEVLKTRKACAKALKSPGAKRNWKPQAGKKRPVTSMPKVLPVPSKRRK